MGRNSGPKRNVSVWEYAPNVPEDSSDLQGVHRDLNLHFPIITSQRVFLCVLAGFMLAKSLATSIFWYHDVSSLDYVFFKGKPAPFPRFSYSFS